MKQQQIFELVEPIVTSFNLELWGIQYSTGRKSGLLRIYIDSPVGIFVDDCEKVSRQVSALLDVEDVIREEYTLEVSSPGVDRPLFRLDQYKRFMGATLSIKLNNPYDERKKFTGKLVAVEDEEIVIIVDDNEYSFPFECIEHARIVPLFN